MPTRRPRHIVTLSCTVAATLVVAGLVVASPTAAVATGIVPTTSDQAPTLEADSFNRLLSDGFGNADTGSAWSISAPAGTTSVADGNGLLRLTSPGVGGAVNLPATSVTDVDVLATIALDRPQTGGGTYVSLVTRHIERVGDYRLKLRFLPTRAVTASLTRTQGTVETTVVSSTVTGLTYSAGDPVHLRLSARGAGPTSLAARIWTGASEPASWQLQATDATSALQVPGGAGLVGYLSGSATAAPMTLAMDDITVTTPATVITTQTPSSDLTSSPSRVLSFASNVEQAGYECSLDAAAFAGCISPTTVTGLVDGAHTFSVRAVDSLGRPAAASSRSWLLDATAPQTSVTGVPTAAAVATLSTVIVTPASSEPSTFDCSLDTAAWAPCADPTTYADLAVGTHTVQVRARDLAGNVDPTPAAWTWVVTAPRVLDVIAPSTSLSADGPGQGSVQTSRSASFGFSADEVAHYECHLDAAPWAACTSPMTFTDVGLGVHTFEVRAIDSAGNVDATPAVRTWTVTAPAPGLTRPDATNTGVPDGTTLTPVYGDLIITTPGATYDSLDVHGFVKIQAPNVTIRRSIIRGGTATGNIGLVTNYGQPGFLIEDSTLTPEHPSVWLDAIKGNNYTARRIEATGTVDTAKIHGDNVRIESSWLHDPVYYASDPNQGGGPTHNDGVQILGGTNITITGNTITVPINQNAAIQITQGYDWLANTTITENWLDGAGCTVNINDLPKPTLTGLTFTNNRFGRNHRYIDCALIAYPGVTMIVTNNVWDDTGLPARLRLNG